MKNTRRTLGVAGLVLLIAAAAAWYRFTPGNAPEGQPSLVTIGWVTFAGLKADFNHHANETRIVVLLSPT